MTKIVALLEPGKIFKYGKILLEQRQNVGEKKIEGRGQKRDEREDRGERRRAEKEERGVWREQLVEMREKRGERKEGRKERGRRQRREDR